MNAEGRQIVSVIFHSTLQLDFLTMVRNYIRMTDRVDNSPGHIVTAVQEILLQNQTVTCVAGISQIPRWHCD